MTTSEDKTKKTRTMTMPEFSDYVEQLFAASFADESTIKYNIRTIENAIRVFLTWDNASEIIKQCKQGNDEYLEIWNNITDTIRNISSSIDKMAKTTGWDDDILVIILLIDNSDTDNEKLLYGILSDGSYEYDETKEPKCR